MHILLILIYDCRCFPLKVRFIHPMLLERANTRWWVFKLQPKTSAYCVHCRELISKIMEKGHKPVSSCTIALTNFSECRWIKLNATHWQYSCEEEGDEVQTYWGTHTYTFMKIDFFSIYNCLCFCLFHNQSMPYKKREQVWLLYIICTVVSPNRTCIARQLSSSLNVTALVHDNAAHGLIQKYFIDGASLHRCNSHRLCV